MLAAMLKYPHAFYHSIESSIQSTIILSVL